MGVLSGKPGVRRCIGCGDLFLPQPWDRPTCSECTRIPRTTGGGGSPYYRTDNESGYLAIARRAMEDGAN